MRVLNMSQLTQILMKYICEQKELTEETLLKIKVIIDASIMCAANGISELAIDFKNIWKGSILEGVDQQEKFNLLTAAIHQKKFAVVELLVDAGAPINDTGLAMPPLFVAANINDIKIIEYLLSKGADINLAQSQEKATALHVAAFNKNYEIVSCLLLNNARIDIQPQGSKKIISYNFTNQTIDCILKAADSLSKAIALFENKDEHKIDLVAANAEFIKAINYDGNFVISYLARMFQETNLRGRAQKHNEDYYHPYFLKFAVGQLKLFIKASNQVGGNFFEKYASKGIDELITHMNAYNCEATYLEGEEIFSKEEKIFETKEKKQKTLAPFEKGLSIATTKDRMKSNKATSAAVITITSNTVNSPVFTPQQSSQGNQQIPSDQNIPENKQEVRL